METWATVALVLGSNIIVALSTFFITKMQVRSSDKRFEKELTRQREIDKRQRKWEVRSKPLLNLRRQLGVMVTLNSNVVVCGTVERSKLLFKKAGQTLQGSRDELDSALRNYYNYIHSGEIDQTLSMLDDKEILDGVAQLNVMNLEAWNSALQLEVPMSIEALHESPAFDGRIEAKAREVQSLINKRLEEL